jgi:ferritin-like metal-binding protein YciE
MKTKEELIDWLRDAYAMERGLELAMQKQVHNEEVSVSVRNQARTHLDETRRHAELVKGCLEELGADPSTIKTGIAEMGEMIKGVSTKFAADERIKDLLAAYAAEHFEIACYRALQAGAKLAGELSIARVCEQIIPEEERMAEWLDANLPAIVQEYLTQQSAAS